MVRFGIAGFGLHAVKRLMPGFALSKRCKVTALSRRTLQQARESAESYRIAYAFDTVDDLAHCSDVDTVLVTSPDSMHREHTLACLRVGKPVLCEKPMAMNAVEAAEMVSVAQKEGVLLGVAQVFRFEESVNFAREVVTSGDLGHISKITVEFHYNAVAHPRKWITDPAMASGGPLTDVGVHCIDALRYILGDEVVRVSTTARQDSLSGPFECDARLRLDFLNGALGEVWVSSRQDYRTPLKIVGASGTLFAADALTVDHPVTISVDSPNRTQELTVSNHLAYAMQVDAFAAASEDGVPFPSSGENGLRNQLVLGAAYRSWRSGGPEEVPIQ